VSIVLSCPFYHRKFSRVRTNHQFNHPGSTFIRDLNLCLISVYRFKICVICGPIRAQFETIGANSRAIRDNSRAIRDNSRQLETIRDIWTQRDYNLEVPALNPATTHSRSPVSAEGGWLTADGYLLSNWYIAIAAVISSPAASRWKNTRRGTCVSMCSKPVAASTGPIIIEMIPRVDCTILP
jgi:hypothetical protein